jgi:DNA (cytosine-5)-methyltransferase 1
VYGITDDETVMRDCLPTMATPSASGGGHPPAVAFGGDIARTLQARHDSSPCADRGMDVVAVTPTLTASNDPSRSPQSSEVTKQVEAVLAATMQVRRLTPVECERLQGFPDGYTDIKPKGKPTPDGPRYKALGNSWAVPVVRWIGKRIANEIA